MTRAICCIGEVLVDFVAPEPSERLLDASVFKRCAGGAPANVAVGIARLGGRSRLIACVGQDCWGDYLRDTLLNENVDTSGLQRTEEASTTLAFVSLSSGGEREFSFMRSPGADTRLASEKLDLEALRECDVLHCGTFSMSSEPARSATLRAIQEVKNNGGLVSLDVNYRASVWESSQLAMDCLESVLPEVDILKVSEEEAQLLTGLADSEKAGERLLCKGPKLVLVSLGSDGCLFLTDTVKVAVSAPVVRCVDATGAGDSFIAAFLRRFVDADLSFSDVGGLKDACRYACAAASMTVTGYGAIPSLPRLSEVEV